MWEYDMIKPCIIKVFHNLQYLITISNKLNVTELTPEAHHDEG